MSRVRPASFDAATKHLFRHLDDWKRLRVNPIAQKCLADLHADGAPTLGERGVLQIRALIRSTVDDLRHQVTSTNGGERVVRQLELIRLQYFENRSIEDAAKLLGLSVKHCYRERAAACRLIALRLMRAEPRAGIVTSKDDAFYTLLGRLVDGDQRSLKENLEAIRFLQRVAQSPQQEIAALHGSIELALALGQRVEAESSFSAAANLLERRFQFIPPELLSAVQASHEMAAWDLAHNNADSRLALAAAKRAVTLLNRTPRLEIAYVIELTVRTYFKLSAVLWNRGNLEDAYDALSRAVSLSRSGNSRSRVTIEARGALWKLRNYLVATKASSYSSDARLDGLRETYVHARDAAFPEEALEVLLSMVECHAFAKRDDQALETARAAMALSRQLNNPLAHFRISIDLGVRLLSTKFWREALTLLPARSILPRLNAYYRELATHAMALCALRRGRYQEAEQLSRDMGVKQLSEGLEIRRQLIAAESAYLLGRGGAAREATHDAAEAAEKLGSAPLMSEAFALATKFLDKKIYASRAGEISRILAA